jgi:hypothetical protein
MSMAKKAGNVLESIKVISFYVMDTTEGGLEPQEFFTKVEVLATTKGFKKVLTVRISSKNVLGFKPFLPTKTFSTRECNANQATQSSQLVGVLRCAVELG